MEASPRPVPPPNRRRDKPQSVCNTCRKGKLRCDRAHPCGNCVRRGLDHACAYANPSIVQSQAAPIVPVETDLAKRFKQLEDLVTSMIPKPAATGSIHTPHQHATPPQPFLPATHTRDEYMEDDRSPSQLLTSPGKLKQDDGCFAYADSSHWTAILDGIHNVNEAIRSMHTQRGRFLFTATVPELHETDLIFGSCPRLNKQQLIAALPSKTIVDMLVGDFFTNKCIDAVIIHKSSFFVEYDQFWELPVGTGTPIIWIAQLYAIAALSVHHQDQPTPLIPDPKRTIHVHKQKIIEALVLGRYTSCPSYTVETLLITYQIEALRSQDTGIDTSLLLAVIIKLATCQGYHRDASEFPNLSALEGEMRRRVWSKLLELDAQSAISSGLPRTLRVRFYSTAEPRNLLDNDFHTDDEVLPLARADTVNTPVQFLILKNRMLAIHGTISDLVSSVSPVAYNDIMSAEMTLHNAHATIPLGLRMYPLPPSGEIKIPYDVVVRRIYIALIFGRAKCVLHQPFLYYHQKDSQYEYSYKTCIEAALDILSYQHLLEVETQAGGRLYQERWRIDKMARNSFLLATSVLCLYLNPTASSGADQGLNYEVRQSVYTSLEHARIVWGQVYIREGSMDAAKAAKAIDLVLSSARSHNADSGTGMKTPSSSSQSRINTDSYHPTDLSRFLLNHPRNSASSPSPKDRSGKYSLATHAELDSRLYWNLGAAQHVSVKIAARSTGCVLCM